MQLALDDIAGFVAPEHVVLCEGGTSAGGSDFDASCYNMIFAGEFPDVAFLGAGNADDIQNDRRHVRRMLTGIAPGMRIIRLIDRDDRRNDEIVDLRGRGVRVLSLRSIESFLLDDSVLEAVCHQLGDGGQAPALLRAKRDAVAGSVAAGGPPDDLKRAAGDIYNAAKRLFPAVKLGSNSRAFMTGICAPLVTACPLLYQQLREDVFGP